MISSLLRDISSYTKKQIYTHCRSVIESGYFDENDLAQECARKVLEAYPKLKNKSDAKAVKKQVALVVHNHLLDVRRKALRVTLPLTRSETFSDSEETVDAWDYSDCETNTYPDPWEAIHHKRHIHELLAWAYEKDIRYFDILQTFIFLPLDNGEFYRSYGNPPKEKRIIFDLIDWALKYDSRIAAIISRHYGSELISLKIKKFNCVSRYVGLSWYYRKLSAEEVKVLLRDAYRKDSDFLPYLKEVFYTTDMQDVVEKKRRPGKGVTLTQVCEFLGYNRYLITRLKNELALAVR